MSFTKLRKKTTTVISCWLFARYQSPNKISSQKFLYNRDMKELKFQITCMHRVFNFAYDILCLLNEQFKSAYPTKDWNTNYTKRRRFSFQFIELATQKIVNPLIMLIIKVSMIVSVIVSMIVLMIAYI